MTELELILKNLDKIGTELYNKFGTDSYNIRCELHDIKDQLKAINYSRCCTELKSEIDPNFKFKNEDFKYSEFIKGVGKEYNYVLGNKHYFVNGVLVKIL